MIFLKKDVIYFADVISISDSKQLTSSPTLDVAFSAMHESFFLPEMSKRQTRTTHVCPGCNTKIYGQYSLNVMCGD